MSTVRAVFRNGAFHPTTPLHIPEATEVAFELPDLSSTSRPSVGGRLEHLKLRIPTAEEFGENRREMAAHFPRDFLIGGSEVAQ